MAKGFTVKAKTPKKSQKAPEWDYDKAKEIMRGKTVVFCLPGRADQVYKYHKIIHQW